MIIPKPKFRNNGRCLVYNPCVLSYSYISDNIVRTRKFSNSGRVSEWIKEQIFRDLKIFSYLRLDKLPPKG